MYCIEGLLGRWSTLRRTSPAGIDTAEILLPREQRVVDLERAAANLDRPLHPSRGHPGIDVAEAAVERLRAAGGRAHGEAEAVVAPLRSRLLGRAHQRGPEAAAAMRPENLDVADLGRRCLAEVRVPYRLALFPRDEVERAGTKREPREPEASRNDGVDIGGRERPDLEPPVAGCPFGGARHGDQSVTKRSRKKQFACSRADMAGARHADRSVTSARPTGSAA